MPGASRSIPDWRIRLAGRNDAEAVLRIYAPIVCETAISFEETSPSAAEMAERIENTIRELPWLVCESDGTLLGYAYAGPFRARPAYQWTVEVTIYVTAEARGRGVGSGLYRSLIACLRLQGFRTAVAVIALPNPASVRLHERLGFELVGVFPRVGYKLGRWHDVGWWRLPLGDESSPAPPRRLTDVMRDPRWEDALAAGELR